MNKKLVFFLALLFVQVPCVFSQAFTRYKTFTIGSGQITGTLTDFPVLIYEPDADFKQTGAGGCSANGSGFDIRPYADTSATTALSYELIPNTYDSATGRFVMFVRVPSASVGSQIHLFCGNAALTTDGSSPTTWRSEYKLVQHLSVTGGGGLSIANSSQSTITPTNSGVTLAAAGQIDSAGDGATGAYIDLGTVADLNITGDITLSAWVKVMAGTTAVLIGGYSNSTFAGYGLSVGNGVATGKIGFWNGGVWTGSNTSVDDNAWHLISVSHYGGVAHFYLDGVADGTPTAAASVTSYSGQRLTFNDTLSAATFLDLADEIHIYAGQLSAEWAAAEYRNQFDPASFTDKGSLISTSYTFIGHVEAGSTNSGVSVTTTPGAVNMTGADLIVACASSYEDIASPPAFTDSQGNLYSSGTRGCDLPLGFCVQMFYKQAPSISATMTFSSTTTTGTAYPAIVVMGFSGSPANPKDQDAIGGADTLLTHQPGSITPTQNNELIVSCMGFGQMAMMTAVNSGFVSPPYQSPHVVGETVGVAGSYLIQTAATAVNPTFTSDVNSHSFTDQLSFYKTPAVVVGAGGSKPLLLRLGL